MVASCTLQFTPHCILLGDRALPATTQHKTLPGAARWHSLDWGCFFVPVQISEVYQPLPYENKPPEVTGGVGVVAANLADIPPRNITCPGPASGAPGKHGHASVPTGQAAIMRAGLLFCVAQLPMPRPHLISQGLPTYYRLALQAPGPFWSSLQAFPPRSACWALWLWWSKSSRAPPAMPWWSPAPGAAPR